MTRARETLALVRFEESHRLQEVLLGKPCILHRANAQASGFAELNQIPEELKFHFVELSLNDVDLGFAGRQWSRHPIHDAIATLRPGVPLLTRITTNNRWELLNQNGLVVGRLASRFEPPANTQCRSAKVLAVVRWSREASKPEYHNSLKCDAWEVIVPELTFEPDSRSAP
jgi:ATP-dependent DNA helicase RecQ